MYKITTFISVVLSNFLQQGGDSALHDAARNGYTQICKQLIEAGAEIDILNKVSLYF